MNENFEIKISGIDYGMIGYHRLDNPKKGVLKKIGAKYINNDCWQKGNVVFNTSSLLKLSQKMSRKKIEDIVGLVNEKYDVVISTDRLIDIQSKFKDADILFISGHHYGDNFHKDYCMPGFTHGDCYPSEGDDGCFGPINSSWFGPSFSFQSLLTVVKKNDDSLNLEYNVYDKVKLIVAVGCKYIRRNMFCLYKRLFPNAVIVGYHCSGPSGDSDNKLLRTFFKNMDWQVFSDASFAENAANLNYKETIVRIWKESVEKTWAVHKCQLAKPGYYYSKEQCENEIELSKYYGKKIKIKKTYEEISKKEIQLELNIPENFETIPYETDNIVLYDYCIKNEKGEVKELPLFFNFRYFDVKQSANDGGVSFVHLKTLKLNNCGIKHGLNYLVDDAYCSEYYSNVCDECDPGEHEELGYIPSSMYESEPFFKRYPHKNREGSKSKSPSWHSIEPEGKIYLVFNACYIENKEEK